MKPYYPQKAPILSYAEGPRLDRAIQALKSPQHGLFISIFEDHLVNRGIQSIQRRGQFLHVTVASGEETKVHVFDFSTDSGAQACLAALTDCLRSQRVPARVLMTGTPEAQDSQDS